MKLSIIIVHHKTPELLKLCLKSLKNNINPQLDHEIIVVDSQSSREGQDVVYENFPTARLITFKENIGYSKGVNTGISAARGDCFLILNPDIIVTKDSIEKMLEFMESNTETGILGPQLLDFSGSVQKSYFRFYTPLTILARRTFLGKLPFFRNTVRKFIMADTDSEKIQYPDWIMGSALLISRKGLEKVGLMDNRFFLYFEDVDWARRFWENGYKVVYFPEAKMYHYHQRKSQAGFDVFDFFVRKETRWHIKSAIKYFLKHGLRSKKTVKVSFQ